MSHTPKNLLWLAALALTACLSSEDSSEATVGADALELRAADSVEVGDMAFDVGVRSGSATIHATVYTNRRCSSRGTTVLAVPGGAGTSFQIGPLARAMFSHPQLGAEVKRVVAIDFPGHGNSPFPINLGEGTQFGDLLIEDYVSVFVQSIEKLRAMNLAPRVVLGHSLGGLIVQTAQQMLLSSGSSLAAHGVKHAVLLAAELPHGFESHAVPSSGEPDFTTDPEFGTYLTVPTTPAGAVEFLRSCFSTRAGVLLPNAPTGEEILAARYMATEPLLLAAQTVEVEITLPSGENVTIPRPTVDAGSFARSQGTRLTLVSFSEDRTTLPDDQRALYGHLTGDTQDRSYHSIVSADAVHCMLISGPNQLLDAVHSHFSD